MTASLTPVEALQKEIDDKTDCFMHPKTNAIYLAALKLAKVCAQDVEQLSVEMLVALNRVVAEVRRD